MANITFSDVLPYLIGGAGLIVAYHFLTNKHDRPQLAAVGNTPNFPDFPRVGIDHPEAGMLPSTDPQLVFRHPYNHPIIPRYTGAPAHFQNSIPLDKGHYIDDVWYDKQSPPIHIKVSQNLPTPETYSHHKMYFETNEPEQTLAEQGKLNNIT